MQRVLRVKAPAKINLGLNVLSRRPDGYHDIETVMQQISLADTILIEPNSSPERIFFCTDPGLSTEDNLVCRASDLMVKEAGNKASGMKITLYKNIPVAAGLAGGSSDAAAVLRGLNRFWKLDFDEQVLMEIGARIGSDVPFCLRGGTALARGRGEKLDSLPPLPFYWVTLVLPLGIKISTAEAYRSFDHKMIGKLSLKPLLKAIKSRNRLKVESWMTKETVNTLESAELPGTDLIRTLKAKLRDHGLWPIYSGSGPAFFMLFKEYSIAVTAARLAETLGADAYLCWTENNLEGCFYV